MENWLNAALAYLEEPANAARIIAAAFGTLGLMVGTYSISSGALLAGDITNAGAAAPAAATAQAQADAKTALENAAVQKACTDGEGEADALISRMKAAFNGPMPGAAQLLAANGSDVGERKQKLIDTVATHYHNLKYCYNPVTKYAAYDKKYKIESADGMNQRMQDIERDKRRVAMMVESMLTSAQDMAMGADQMTTSRMAALSGQTASKLGDYATQVQQASIANQNEQTKVLANIALQLENIAKATRKTAEIKAFEHADTDKEGGEGDKEEKKFKYSSQLFEQPLEDPVTPYTGGTASAPAPTREGLQDAAVGANEAIANMEFRFGLLNLVSPEARQKYFDDIFPRAAMEYMAVSKGIDATDSSKGLQANLAAIMKIDPSKLTAFLCDGDISSGDAGACFGVGNNTSME